MSAEPILVLYKSSMCRHCSSLSAIWDTPPNKDEDSVSSALKKVYPKLRFYVVTAKDNTGKFDENTAPKDLIRYGKWFPMILLVPGRLWDEAMSKLGPKNDVKLVDGVQIMNGKLDNGVPKYVQEYDIRRPSEFGRWLEKALNDDEFKKVQAGIAAPQNVPATSPLANPIQPLLSSIIKPSNAGANFALTNPRTHTASAVVDLNNDFGGDFCSMKIISRPK